MVRAWACRVRAEALQTGTGTAVGGRRLSSRHASLRRRQATPPAARELRAEAVAWGGVDGGILIGV